MNKIFLAVIFIITMSIETLAQQMIPNQKGFEISYSVFPQSPEKQNYALGAGVISYTKTVITSLDWPNTAESITSMPITISQLIPSYSMGVTVSMCGEI